MSYVTLLSYCDDVRSNGIEHNLMVGVMEIYDTDGTGTEQLWTF